jgi:hypothetical protein
MAWLNPAALTGLVVLAGPILVHLLLRHRARRVAFPSLRFVRASRTAAARLRLPSDPFLLLVRLAIVGLAVLALAQPLVIVPARIASWNARAARAIVVDVSESMKPVAADAAKAAAAEARSTAFAWRIDASDLEAGFAKAVTVLKTAPPAQREIVVISDFQTGALQPADLERIAPDIGLRFVQLGRAPAERIVHGVNVLSADGSLVREFVLSAEATRLRPLVAQPATTGLDLVASPSDAAAVQSLRKAVIAAGTPAPSPQEPVAVVFAGVPLPAVRPLKTGWMLETVLRLQRDRDIAQACERSGAMTPARSNAPWRTLCYDSDGRALVSAAATDAALAVNVSAPASAYIAAAVVRGVLVARQGSDARPEDEVRTMSRAELTKLMRAPGPVTRIQEPGQTSDARWCWALVLVLMAIETVARRVRNASAEKAHSHVA